MAHKHSHHYDHKTRGKNLLISIVLNILITVSQIIGGFLSGSLALLSDAMHNLSDVLSLIISYIANALSKKKASGRKTFGYKRAEIIAAFVNASSLMIVAVFLIIEAIKRFQNPEPIESDLVIWLSVIAILANGFSVLLLKKDADSNMNMKTAYLHLLTDMMASVAVLIGGLLMKYFDMFWVDSLLTMAIAVYLIVMGYKLLIKSTNVLMLFAPETIEIKEIEKEILQITQIKNIHHIHIWQLNEEETHLEAHIDLRNDIKISEFDTILNQLETVLLYKFGINHVNIQPEFDKSDKKDLIVQD